MKTLYKTFKSVLSLTILFASFTSCEELRFGNEFLNQTPDQIGVSMDTVFSKKHYAMQVLTKAYTNLPYGIPVGNNPSLGGDLSESLTDLSYSSCSYGGARQLYYTGAYSAGKEGTKSKFLFNDNKTWSSIRYAWLMIENVERVPDMTRDEKDRAIAEAKMIIATQYATMFRHFGGLPYVDHAIMPDGTFHYERMTVEQTVNTIVGLIDDAIPHLEWKVSDKNDDGRMTSAYAMALKLRVLLFAASPLFNSDEPYLEGKAATEKLTWYGDYKKDRWDRAMKAGQDFMNALAANGGYQLVQADKPQETFYKKAFRKAYFERDNGEVLLSTRLGYKNKFSSCFAGGNNIFGFKQCPTKAYIDMFPDNKGNDYVIEDWTAEGLEPFKNRDPRFYETIMTNGTKYKSSYIQLFVGGKERPTETTNGTGFVLFKFALNYNNATSLGAIDSWPYLRLPEVFLSYAEAINEVKGGPDDVAYNMINMVRNRVGLKDLPDDLDKVAFRKALLRERACEFGFEDVRWFDVVRWKMEDVFRAPVDGINTYRHVEGDVTTFSYKVFSLQPERIWKNQWSPKWYLSAFPVNEIDKNYGLIQNPGW